MVQVEVPINIQKKNGGRVVINGTGRQTKKYKNRAETYEFKLEVLLYYEEHTMKETIAKFYGITPSSSRLFSSKRRCIQRWNLDKDKIIKMASKEPTKKLLRSRKLGCATTLSKEDEDEIVQWINALRGEGIPISSVMLRLHALQVADDAGITHGFSATSSWIKSFLSRHRLSLRQKTRQGQVRPQDAEKILRDFMAEVRNLVVSNNVERIYNADQTAIFYEYLPKTTIDKKGSKTVWVKCGGKEKERLTAMLLGDNCGTKYPPFVVLKSKPSTIPTIREENDKLRNGFGRQTWKEISMVQNQTGMVIFGNKNGWWNTKLSLDFLQHFFGERDAKDTPVLLLWDDFGAHWTPEVVEYAKSKSVILHKVPPACTFCCQPADIAWMKPLKDQLRAFWKSYLYDQVQSLIGNRCNNNCTEKKQKIDPPSRKIVLEWLHKAWINLQNTTISHGFKVVNLLFDQRVVESATIDVDNILVEKLSKLNVLDDEVGQVGDSDDIVEVYLEETTSSLDRSL